MTEAWDIKLIKADIVILASEHTPSIMSPQWLKDKDIITENHTNFINTPEFALFESNTYSLIIDRQRLQIGIRSNDKDGHVLNSVAKIAKRYVTLLNQIPYTSMGLNFTLSLTAKESEKIPSIEVKVGSDKGLKDSLTDHELSYGCVVNARKDPYLLKLTIAPQGEKTLIYNFNYHHEVKDLKVDTICEYIENYVRLCAYSRSVVERTIQ